MYYAIWHDEYGSVKSKASKRKETNVVCKIMLHALCGKVMSFDIRYRFQGIFIIAFCHPRTLPGPKAVQVE